MRPLTWETQVPMQRVLMLPHRDTWTPIHRPHSHYNGGVPIFLPLEPCCGFPDPRTPCPDSLAPASRVSQGLGAGGQVGCPHSVKDGPLWGRREQGWEECGQAWGPNSPPPKEWMKHCPSWSCPDRRQGASHTVACAVEGGVLNLHTYWGDLRQVT